jgi:hypothetical protein
LQVGDTGPVESARRSNSRVLGSPFSGLSGQKLTKFAMLSSTCSVQVTSCLELKNPKSMLDFIIIAFCVCLRLIPVL